MALSIALILGSVGPSGRKQMASVFSARVLMAWPLSCPMFYSSTAGAGPAVTPMKKIVWNVREWRSCDSLEFTLLKINMPALTFSVISNKLLSTCSQQTPWEKITVVTFDLGSNYFLRFWKIDEECVDTSGDQFIRGLLNPVPQPSIWRCLWTGAWVLVGSL